MVGVLHNIRLFRFYNYLLCSPRVELRLATPDESSAIRQDIVRQDRWDDHWDDRSVYVLVYKTHRKYSKEIKLGYGRHWTDEHHNNTHIALSGTIYRPYRGAGLGLKLLEERIKAVAPNDAWLMDIEVKEGKDGRPHHYPRLGFQQIDESEVPEPYTDQDTGLIDPDGNPQLFLRWTPKTAKPFRPTLKERIVGAWLFIGLDRT